MTRSSDTFAVRLARRAIGGLVTLALTFALPALSHAAKPVPAPVPPPAPAPDFPSGCEPDLLRSQLATTDSADVARACGNLRMPWGYRGRIGRELAMRSYGRRAVDGAWARRLVETLLESATVDTIYRAPAFVASCKPSETPPIYLVRLHQGGVATSVLFRFDLGVATVFAAEAPLGLIALGERSDSLWALLGRALEDDPAFRDPPPAPKDSLFTILQVTGEAITVDSAPLVMGRVRDTPPYPEAARRQGVEGTVHVLARVNTFGRVEDAVVHAGPAPLRDVALETVWGVRFTPARVQGKPVAAWTMVPLQFRAR